MKKATAAIAIQIAVFAVLAILGIMYVLKESPTENLGDYEKSEMARPSHGGSFIDKIFSTDGDDDTSLTGSAGRYEESRIGKPMPTEDR